MNHADTPAPIPRGLMILAALLALFFIANGTFMLVNPQAWYWAVAGVPDTGSFNQHFVRDIGFVYFTSGIGMALGIQFASLRAGLWIAAGAWQVGHALFHIWEVVVGICTPDALIRDFPGVMLPAILATLLAVWSVRR